MQSVCIIMISAAKLDTCARETLSIEDLMLQKAFRNLTALHFWLSYFCAISQDIWGRGVLHFDESCVQLDESDETNISTQEMGSKSQK